MIHTESHMSGSECKTAIALDTDLGHMQTYPEYCRTQLEAGSNRLNFAIADLEAAHGQVLSSSSYCHMFSTLLCLQSRCMTPCPYGTLIARQHAASQQAGCPAVCMDDQARLWNLVG